MLFRQRLVSWVEREFSSGESKEILLGALLVIAFGLAIVIVRRFT
jgi:hypothetical protein